MPRKAAQTAPFTLMPLACSALQVDTSIQPRLALDSQVITKYATLYEEDEEGQTTLPPLDVFQVEGAYYVADGFHRLAAALQASRDTVPCRVYVGTRRDAMVHAVYANVRRGLDYSYGDKQQILERLLADPEIAQLGDRALAQDLSMSHMTVWRTRTRLEEEARLQAEIAALPATATAPKVREQEQLAAYLGVDVDDVKRSLGTSPMRYESPQAMIKEIARRALRDGETPSSAAELVARHIQSVGGLTTRPRTEPRERPSQSKAEVAARRAEARREKCYELLTDALYHLGVLYPFTEEERESELYAYTTYFIRSWPSPHPTAEELVAAVLSRDAEAIAQRLMYARTVLDSLCSAWETRMQETAAIA